MISFPNAKINIGLNIVSRRPDGYHNLETIFYPVQVCDALEMVPGDKTELIITGLNIEGDPGENLILKAYRILKDNYGLPPMKFHLHKIIPFGAGLGGGSSDAAFTLQMVNTWFNLGITKGELEKTAAKIGADCPFFIGNETAFASGTGDQLEKFPVDLSDYRILIVKPPFGVNTREAYQNIIPANPVFNLKDLAKKPVPEWRDTIINDFEKPVFKLFPLISEIKDILYRMGALYASMSGSGSAVFGIFRHLPVNPEDFLPAGVLIYR